MNFQKYRENTRASLSIAILCFIIVPDTIAIWVVCSWIITSSVSRLRSIFCASIIAWQRAFVPFSPGTPATQNLKINE